MKHTALVVDDEPLVRTYVAYLLKFLNWDVLVAESFEQACELYQEYEDSIIYLFTDYNLPKGNGLDLYRKIRKKSAIPTVVLSSGFPNMDLQEIERDPNAYFLPKPFSPESLMGTVRRIKHPIPFGLNMRKQSSAA